MTVSRSTTTTLVVGGRMVGLRVTDLDSPKELGVEVVVGGGDVIWRSVEPGWRAISYGFANGRLYWWSARRLVLVEARRCLEVAGVDEDIVAAFDAPGGWVVVTETSVRRVASGERLEFGVVLCAASLEGEALAVEDEDGVTISIRLGRDGLAIQ